MSVVQTLTVLPIRLRPWSMRQRVSSDASGDPIDELLAVGRVVRVAIPTAQLISMHDMIPPPREICERFYNVTRWRTTGVGGHFLEWEEPQLVADDMRAFFGERISG